MKKVFLLLFLFFSQFHFAQKETNIWYFGIGAGIDFNSGTATAITSTQIITDIGSSASICSSQGELLFYTDGQFIYNKQHEVMQNGENIGGTTGSTQVAVIAPKLGDSNVYYVFTTGYQADHRGMKYTIVDMRLGDGLGGVTAKDLFLSNLVTEKLTAVKSTSFNGYWVVAHRWYSNKFMVFKVTSSGVDTTPTEYTIGLRIEGDVTNTRGQLKLAPNRQKLAMANEGIVNELYFFDFDPSTGEISNPQLILDENADTKVYGIEFSPGPEKTSAENIELLKKYIKDKEAQLVNAFNRDELVTEILIKNGFKLNYTLTKQAEFKKNEILFATDGDKETLICLDVIIADETVEHFKTNTNQKLIVLERALGTTKKWNLKHAMGDKFNAF